MKGPGGSTTQAGCETYDKYRSLYNLVLTKPGLGRSSDEICLFTGIAGVHAPYNAILALVLGCKKRF